MPKFEISMFNLVLNKKMQQITTVKNNANNSFIFHEITQQKKATTSVDVTSYTSF